MGGGDEGFVGIGVGVIDVGLFLELSVEQAVVDTKSHCGEVSIQLFKEDKKVAYRD